MPRSARTGSVPPSKSHATTMSTANPIGPGYVIVFGMILCRRSMAEIAGITARSAATITPTQIRA